ncbi:putative membrane protein [Francisella frigiditurris]|uniref:Putative membrane protein n=1 Tax=Francisella frigiditurris TaxID=1542390 RepID=A0A1J0KSC0_9GAMM|nr:putative membrane protein [Francisella frigiditurris]
MILASLIAIIVALLVTLILARMLYRFSYKKGMLQSRKDRVLNAIIIAFIFFCLSSFVYIGVINII